VQRKQVAASAVDGIDNSTGREPDFHSDNSGPVPFRLVSPLPLQGVLGHGKATGVRTRTHVAILFHMPLPNKPYLHIPT
jgi:hypothetical protein